MIGSSIGGTHYNHAPVPTTSRRFVSTRGGRPAAIGAAGTWLVILLAVLAQLACGSPPAVPQATPAAAPEKPAAETRPAAPAPETPQPEAPPTGELYDLGRDEARGGHTLARHVGRSDDQLRQRLRDEPRISAASSYTDRPLAERTVARTLSRNKRRIDQWLARSGSRPNLALDYRGTRQETIGRSVTRRSPQAVACTDAVVVLRWDGGRGFFVLTSYPEVSR